MNNQNNVAHEVREASIDKTIKICTASINIEIHCLYGSSFHAFQNYIKDFDEPDISIQITQEDIDCECKYHKEIRNPDVVVQDNNVMVTYDYGCMEPFVALKKVADAVVPFDTFLFHGAVVEKDGLAYMFTAPSGVGKTTRLQLWLEQYPDSIIVNGDKPFIKVTHDGVLACGSPWAGKEGWNNNVMVPLHAIFLLERSADEKESTIEEIGIGKMFPFLLQQAHYPKDAKILMKTIQLIKQMDGKVQFYRFKSAPNVDAIKLAYETSRPR